jgi:hypothetical protein
LWEAIHKKVNTLKTLGLDGTQVGVGGGSHSHANGGFALLEV